MELPPLFQEEVFKMLWTTGASLLRRKVDVKMKKAHFSTHMNTMLVTFEGFCIQLHHMKPEKGFQFSL